MPDFHPNIDAILNICNFSAVKTWQDDFTAQELQWLGEDNEENYKRKLKDPHTRKKLETYGWLDQSLDYKFNSFGFRGKEPNKTAPHFCVFGDSVSFGMAIRQESIYHEILSTAIGLDSYNFSVAGSSDATAVRLALTWLQDLSPRFVIWQQTFDHRYEMIEHDYNAVTYGVQAAGGGLPPTTSDKFYQAWINCDENRYLAKIKNICTMRYICQQLDLPLVEIDINDFFSQGMDFGRDLLHPGPQCHRKVYQQIELSVSQYCQ